MNWLAGYGQRPRSAPLPEPAAVVPITCPACGSDQIKVRSSDRVTSYLQCTECNHGDGETLWKITRRVRRVIIVIDQ